MGIVFFLIIVILFFSFVALEIIAIRRWRKVWRWLALLPGAALTIVILNILVGTLLDRTSHNLWPMEIVVWSAGGLVYLGVLSLIRKIVTKK
jgi:hypothetical protein